MSYIETLKDWERDVADPAIYENIDRLFPQYGFRRVNPGLDKDHWASPLKLNLSQPKTKTAEKTVIYRTEMRFREQGEWANSMSVKDKIMYDQGLTSIIDAYRYAASILGLDMPYSNPGEAEEYISRSQKRKNILQELQNYFVWNIENNSSAKASAVREYLENEREFSKEDVKEIGFGFVPEWGKVIRYMTKKICTIEELDDACPVRNQEGYTGVGKYNVLSIPYICAGELKGFLFRRIGNESDGPKYMANHDLDRKSVFFNIPETEPLYEILVVEGELDALKATASGIPNVVAIGGSEVTGTRRAQIEDAIKRGVRRIYLCLDLDELKDGRTPNYEARHLHVMKTIHTIKDVDISFEGIFVVNLPYSTDPDKFLRLHGAEGFKVLLAGAMPYWKYIEDYQSRFVKM